MPLFNPSAQAETFVLIRAIRGQNPISTSWNIRANSCNSWANPHQRKLKYSYKFVQFVGEPPSAQAETFVKIREIRGRNPISASWKYSCKFVRFVSETPSAQAETFVSIRTICGQNLISASWNIRVNSQDSWAKKISAQAEIFVQIHKHRGIATWKIFV